jgi:hypothetical protein
MLNTDDSYLYAMRVAQLNSADAEKYLAGAIQYLIQGDEKDAATILLFCNAEMERSTDDWKEHDLTIHLTGPRSAYDALSTEDHPVFVAVMRAFSAVIPATQWWTDYAARLRFIGITVRMSTEVISDPDWRQHLLEIAEGTAVSNQGVEFPNRSIVTWANLNFRSEAEARVARALDAAGLFFLPNCRGRLGPKGGPRETREADFLICDGGKWGILEVDGPFHPRAALDHERDRLFKSHGITCIERFTAEECYSNAPRVIQRFLDVLRSHR